MSYSATLGRVQSMGGSIPPLPQISVDSEYIFGWKCIRRT